MVGWLVLGACTVTDCWGVGTVGGLQGWFPWDPSWLIWCCCLVDMVFHVAFVCLVICCYVLARVLVL